MSFGTRARWLAVGAVAALAVVGIVAFGAAVSVLKGKVAAALGPSSETSAIRIGGSGVVVEGLRIPAPSGWPAPDALRAERVRVVPSLRSVVSGDPYRIRSVTVTRAYLSVLRSRGGTWIAMPGSRGGATPKDEEAGGSLRVRLGKIALEDSVLEIFDARVATPPLKIRLEQIEASVYDVNVPAPHDRSSFELDGVVKGVPEDGHAHIAGWVDIGTRDSSITTQLLSVDLVPLEPYLIQKGEAGIRAGRFDLDLQSEVNAERLRAPGKLTIRGLQLEPDDGVLSTFMGVSQGALLAALEEKGGSISVDFTIEGDIDRPEFSLDEALSTKLAFALAETLGVSLGGLVEGVGTIGLKGGDAAGEAAKGVSGAFRELFEDKPKR